MALEMALKAGASSEHLRSFSAPERALHVQHQLIRIELPAIEIELESSRDEPRMALAPSTRLGSYEILSLVGVGGMGEVYRARDPRLGRDVAIKILPVDVANDADRLRRFEQEARAAGQLNHPNILVVHDVGSADGRPFIVSELLDGQTLRERIKAGRLALSAALDCAIQIARGLQAAHDKGIVHRDLKPENVFITRDGRVKILDFGLAKLVAPAAVSEGAATETDHRTEPGVIMGTAGYMAPEQVRGEAADHRADVFAFGALLYELLTGARAYGGASRMDVLSAILRTDAPEAATANPAVPAALSRIVRRCMERQPDARFQSTSDLSFALETLSASGAATSAAIPAGGHSRIRTRAGASWVVAAVLTTALAALSWAYLQRPSPATQVFGASVGPTDGSDLSSFVVSPDGKWVAFTNVGVGKSRLWLRSLDTLIVSTTALEGTDGASFPFWSPDSLSLGFFADNQLKIVGITGGPARALSNVIDSRGGAWGRDDVIVFAPDLRGPIYAVSAKTAGARTAATRLDGDRKHGSHRWPHFLPDGRHFVYFARSTQPDFTGLYVGAIGDPQSTFVGQSSTDGVFAPPGFLLFVRGETLVAQTFDPARLTLTGTPVQLVPHVGFSQSLNRGSFSISDTGVLAYGNDENNRPVWFDRGGKAHEVVAQDASNANLDLSRRGDRLALERPDPLTGANDVFVIELDRGGIATRITTSPSSDTRAVWAADDQRLIWASNRTSVYDLYSKAISGTDETPLLVSPDSKIPTDVTPDGRFLLYESTESAAKTSVRALWLTGENRSFPLLESGFNEAQARVSPDGRWISYTTDKDGANEVYIVEAASVLPAPGSLTPPRHAGGLSSRRVSSNGGVQSMWRSDRKASELYYLAADRRLMAVPMTASGPGVPIPLFETRIMELRRAYQYYAPSPDGQRFLVLTPVAPRSAATIVLNWTDALARSK